VDDQELRTWTYDMLKSAVESAGAWRRIERLAVSRFGYDSPQHNMVREQLSINLGADVGEYEAEAIALDGDAAREFARQIKAENDLLFDEKEFWPGVEAQRYFALVTKAGIDQQEQRRLRGLWEELAKAAEDEPTASFGELPPPDWLDA
jgi:hypothetical protein